MLGELTQEEIHEVLAGNMNGRIGYTDGDKVYIMPVNYAFNGDHLILHSREGGKVEKLREHPHVCFEVDEIHDQTNWRTVLAWGDYEEVTDEKEKYYAMKFLVSRLLHLKVSETTALEAGEQEPKPVIYRIRIKESTGRFEKS